MSVWKDLVILTILAAASVITVLKFGPSDNPGKIGGHPSAAAENDREKQPAVMRLYGIPVSSFAIRTDKVKRGESLAELLHPYGVSLQDIYNISLLPDSLINERKIIPGNRYTLFSTNDTTPDYFVYEKDAANYVVIRLSSDSIWAQNGKKPVEHRLSRASGTIRTSLWESMHELDLNPMLAIELSEIYAWSIDFFGLQEDDRYKIIYEESYVDSQSVGIHKIEGAWFYHNGVEFWAIPFIQDSLRSFFDEEGNSLRKAFLKAPLRFSRISSGFSNSRLHPILKIRRPHHGIDYAAPVGTPVQAIGDGVVFKAAYESGGGNYVKIKHNSVYSTTYMHLSRFGKGIRQGVYVKQGDIIGYVGSTGLSTGPHLDFRFYMNGSAINPLRVKAPPVEPLDSSNLVGFEIVRGITLHELQVIN